MDWGNIAQASFSAFFGVNAMYFAIAAIGLNVQFGYTGLLNFGQAGFMACGAYALGMTSHKFGISLWWGIPIAIAYALLLGLIMGIPTLRLRADYLAIVTIALAEVIRLTVRSVTFKDFYGGSDGINGFAEEFRRLTPFNVSGRYDLDPFSERVDTPARIALLVAFVLVSVLLARLATDRLRRRFGWPMLPVWGALSVAWFALLLFAFDRVTYQGLAFKSLTVGWVLVAILGWFVWLAMRSPWGRVLKAIREDEDAVRSLGKNVYSYKLQALVVGGAIATFSGMMFSLDRGSVQPDNYSRDVTFFVLTALVLGGAAKVSGSIVGPMLFWGILAFTDVFLNELYKAWGGRIAVFGLTLIASPSQIGQFQQMLVGLMLILLMVFRPQGLFGNRKEMALDGR
jgi:branched-chain amino acid transport system permease protein